MITRRFEAIHATPLHRYYATYVDIYIYIYNTNVNYSVDFLVLRKTVKWEEELRCC